MLKELNISNVWQLDYSTIEDKGTMQSLFSFTYNFFVEIFGEDVMSTEPCILYNDKNAGCPMLITDENPIRIRTSVKDLVYWGQYLYHLSHEMTHYIIRQYKEDKTLYINWFEETICEAMSLYILKISSERWNECELSRNAPYYREGLESYWTSIYKQTQESVLKRCHTYKELEDIERNCIIKREGRSLERNYLFDTFCKMPNSISEFVYYPFYVCNHIQIDFKLWEREREKDLLITQLESIQPKLMV